MAKAWPATCPRCGGRVSVRHGDVVCLRVCGFDGSGGRAWDAVEEPPPLVDRETAPRSGDEWSGAELGFLVEQKDVLSAADIGRALGRSEHAVHQKLSKMRWAKDRVERPGSTQSPEVSEAPPGGRWQDAEVADLEDFARPGRLLSLARRAGRSHDAVRSRMRRDGIRARENDGMLSAAEVSRLYSCDEERVVRLIELEIIDPKRVQRSGRFWRIDPGAAEEAGAWLRRKGRGGRPRKGGVARG